MASGEKSWGIYVQGPPFRYRTIVARHSTLPGRGNRKTSRFIGASQSEIFPTMQVRGSLEWIDSKGLL